MLTPLHLRFYNEIRDTLLAMHLDEAGRDIPEKHKTRVWTEVDPFELNTMTTMLNPGRQTSHHKYNRKIAYGQVSIFGSSDQKFADRHYSVAEELSRC